MSNSNTASNPMDLTDEDFDVIFKALEAYPGSTAAGFMLASIVEMVRSDKNKLSKEAEFDQMTASQREKERTMKREIIMPMAKIKIMQDDLRSKGTYHRCERDHSTLPNGPVFGGVVE